MTILYHAHRPHHVGMLLEGYIGISDNFTERVKRHRAGYSGSERLKRAINKYKDVVFTPISEGTREHMLELENYFRPEKMSWNLTPGGGDPPTMLGREMPETQRKKIGEANRKVQIANNKGWWTVSGLRFDSMVLAAKEFGISKATVRNRCMNPSFPEWNFESKGKR